MNKSMIQIHNVETGEIEIREMTDEEFTKYEADNAGAELENARIAQEKLQKKALLDKLGITEEEAKLLLS